MRLLLASLSLAWTAGAADLLISPGALRAELGRPAGLVLLHVGSPQDYEAGHIAGAQLVTLADLSVSGENNLRLQLPPAEVLHQKLMKLGVGDGSRVIIYAGNESVQSATRIWFTFDYLTLPARLLNGGVAAWKSAGYETTKDVPTITAATTLTIKPRPEVVVDAAWLASHLNDPNLTLIDARLNDFYTGKSAGNMPRPGHIPGATNVPFTTLLTPTKEFLPSDKLGDKPIVTYCHIGMQATVVYFSARLAGKEVKLYDGSYEDWSRRTDLPVEVVK